MLGGASTLARAFLEQNEDASPSPDIIMATDMLDLTTFLALTRSKTAQIPVVLYMHENQLTYPLPKDGSKGPMRRQMGARDRHYVLINFFSMLAADRLFFNSEYHLNQFFNALPAFLRHYPEYNELETLGPLREKSSVLPVGVDLWPLSERDGSTKPEDGPPLILWNQRLEYDKNPLLFIKALKVIDEEGLPFQIALCGERFGKPESFFEEFVAMLADKIVHNGYANEEEYRRLLEQAAIIVSTADHENFGIGALEAVHAKTFPILPNRLSYPELIPPEYHSDCLYTNFEGLLSRLRWALQNPAAAHSIATRLSTHVSAYNWRRIAPIYDDTLARLFVDR